MDNIYFLRFFRKKEDGILRTHIKNLVAVGTADGKFTSDEQDLVKSIAGKAGISSDKLQQMLNTMSAECEIPTDKIMRFNQLYDLVHLMIVDNYIHYEEQRYCINAAIKFGYPATQAEQIVELIIGNINSGESPEGARVRLGYFFDCI